MGIFKKIKKKKRNDENTSEVILAQMDELINSDSLSKGINPNFSFVTSESHGVFTIEIKFIRSKKPETLIGEFKGKDIELKISKWMDENNLGEFKQQVANSISLKILEKQQNKKSI